ncbi:gluconokinase [Paracoccus spongiarum]|uniref:Gluconokinase n=1 Tax=Paracoccus spongiarum TaxID=3064387 RepID=A0ABT9JFX8_9RHOB|nr:gluconokinase, GntK/IdnK-type [Paracoccus sp. 2205BS29-5]MDP5308684.1 gluconokinase, GntK/IdnK-type [Paracoccus sp. 2205BS29-5]
MEQHGDPPPLRPCVMVMGPSGVGKSTFAEALAVALEADFIEGDDHHPPANRAAMAAGTPLTDAMRAPWLAALAAAVRAARSRRAVVFSCSALKRSYRDSLREGIGPLRIVSLTAPAGLIRTRMGQRRHFMPSALLDSQIETLQPPEADEAAITLDMSRSLAEVLHEAVAQLRH